MQHKENDFVIPALKVIQKHKKCSMDVIKDEIDEFILLNDKDKEKSNSRNESKYRQIVGNLVSHENKSFMKYIDQEIPNDEIFSKTPKRLFSLNVEGVKFLNSIAEQEILEELDDADEDILISKADVLDDDLLSILDNRQVDLSKKTNYSNRPKTDPRIAATVIKKCNYDCLNATLNMEKHTTFINMNGKKYVEAHHLIPMKASKDFGVNLDRSSNIVPLCPLCHARIHYGNIDEKIEVLKKLYDKCMPKLEEDGIFISFNDLLNKYYL